MCRLQDNFLLPMSYLKFIGLRYCAVVSRSAPNIYYGSAINPIRPHPALMFKTLLEYPITRPVVLGIWFNALVVLFMIGWTAIITLVSVASVAYELVPVTSTQYNSTYNLFYEKFIPSSSWLPETRTCDSSIIKLTEGSCSHLLG